LRIGLLTSSRADYGIYLPLIRLIHKEPSFNLNLIVFGSHLSKTYGKTIKQIKYDGFKVDYKTKTLSKGDKPEDMSISMATTIKGLTKIWGKNSFDLIFALGDRYEMFAAVSSVLPFIIPVAHIHGGETTLGAIDNAFRHSITCMSKFHFTSADEYRKRVMEIIGSDENVYNVGALSIDAIQSLDLLTIEQFNAKYKIDLSLPTILVTFHPETVGIEKNKIYIRELIAAMKLLTSYQIVITMPNADTMGLMIRHKLHEFIHENRNVIGIETFGSLGYLSCMKHCKLMLGNTSSGFIEAYYFQKPVVNLGNRQKGRIITQNIFNCTVEKEAILDCIKKADSYSPQVGVDQIYGTGNTAEKIIKIFKK